MISLPLLSAPREAGTTSTADEWWSRLLGIDNLDLSKGEWSLGWHHPLPAWLLVLVIIPAIMGIIWLIYRQDRREDVPRGPRLFLTFLRAALILLVVILLLGPVLTVTLHQPRKSYVVVLLDESRSMLRTDPIIEEPDRRLVAETTGMIEPGGDLPPDADELFRRISRTDIVERLMENPRIGLLDRIEKDFNVQYFAFSRGIRRAESREDLFSVAPSGTETAIGDAVRRTLGQLRGQEVRAVIVFSDGRSNSGTDPVSVSRELRSRYIPVYTVPAGLRTPPRDIQISELEALDAVLANDPLRLRFSLRAPGFEGQSLETSLHVVTLDEAAPPPSIPRDADKLEDLIRDSVTHATWQIKATDDGGRTDETTHFRSDRPGEYLLILRVRPREGETDRNNNYLVHRVRVADDKIRILFVDHLPRYEYRYLKNALIRDPKVLVHCLLTSADIGFPQEHTIETDVEAFKKPLEQFPSTLQELLQYDVVVIGDVDLDRIGGSRAAEHLRTFVGEFGGGIVFCSGTRVNPRDYVHTPLSALLPVVPQDDGPIIDDTVYTEELPYRLTPSGSAHEIIRDCYPSLADAPERLVEFWEDRDNRHDGQHPVRWVAPVRSVKPGAQVLMTAGDDKETAPPLFAVQHFGRGRVFWSGTDETWLWRYRTGESPWFYPFWRQAIYWSRQGKLLGAVRTRVEVDKDRYMQNETVHIFASAYDRNYEPLTDPQLTARINPPEGERIEVLLSRDNSRKGYYEGTFHPTVLGRYHIWAGNETGLHHPGGDRFVVFIPNREDINPALDPDMLRSIADESHQAKSGPNHSQFYSLDRIHKLPDDLSKAGHLIVEEKTDDLWDSPLVYLLFALLISTEWILRKLYRML